MQNHQVSQILYNINYIKLFIDPLASIVKHPPYFVLSQRLIANTAAQELVNDYHVLLEKVELDINILFFDLFHGRFITG